MAQGFGKRPDNKQVYLPYFWLSSTTGKRHVSLARTSHVGFLTGLQSGLQLTTAVSFVLAALATMVESMK